MTGIPARSSVYSAARAARLVRIGRTLARPGAGFGHAGCLRFLIPHTGVIGSVFRVYPNDTPRPAATQHRGSIHQAHLPITSLWEYSENPLFPEDHPAVRETTSSRGPSGRCRLSRCVSTNAGRPTISDRDGRYTGLPPDMTNGADAAPPDASGTGLDSSAQTSGLAHLVSLTAARLGIPSARTVLPAVRADRLLAAADHKSRPQSFLRAAQPVATVYWLFAGNIRGISASGPSLAGRLKSLRIPISYSGLRHRRAGGEMRRGRGGAALGVRAGHCCGPSVRRHRPGLGRAGEGFGQHPLCHQDLVDQRRRDGL